MKKALQLFLLVAVLMTAFTFSADAQYKRKKKKKKKKKTSKTDDYFDDVGTFKDRLWYGADVSLGFSGLNGGNAFTAGIAPMVGYKITENFSAGPRLDLLYSSYRFASGGQGADFKLNTTNVGVGAFTRLKILQLYFLQFEYQWLNNEIPLVINNQVQIDGNKILSEREGESHYYIGGGYSSSMGLVGFQVTALWDLSQEFSSNNIPIVTRIGLNYKF